MTASGPFWSPFASARVRLHESLRCAAVLDYRPPAQGTLEVRWRHQLILHTLAAEHVMPPGPFAHS